MIRRALLLLLLAAPAWAGPFTVEECVAASTAAQEHQKKGALSAAKHQLTRCADQSCPGVVQADCTRWLDEVLAAMPTVTIAVRLDGVDQPKARVFLDGRPWIEELTGHPVELDPGEHLLTAHVGAREQEQRVLINLAEKNRLLVFQLRTPDEVVQPVTPTPTPPEVQQPAPGRGFPAFATAMTVTAAAGLGLFTGLGLSGRLALDALLAEPCAETKTCDPARVSSIQSRFLAADVALGVGVAAALVAAWQWWAWAASEPALTPTVTLLPGGGSLGLSARW